MKIYKPLSVAMTAALLSPFGGMANADEVADVHFGISSISFYPNVDYAKASLTVAGAGIYEQQTFESGDPISFSASSELADGDYKYELVTMPESNEVAWAAAAGNEAEEKVLYEQESAETFYQSGGFEIVMGQIKEIERAGDATDQ